MPSGSEREGKIASIGEPRPELIDQAKERDPERGKAFPRAREKKPASDGWESPSQYLVLERVRLAYGEQVIPQALSASRMVTTTTQDRYTGPEAEGLALKLPLRAG
ncbi:hypothetical protein [Candidatus Methylacidithermus pantelleriae]|uniref:Uncharacterized protein n=1 Tax=Candidatus Methylacidithermus pantelleriae TaxID=2744239 RepID=A0A8J2FPS4_9BACT|nr:hypothetical protein [Candidatus Methylacidithermus pantelleriae]CAF0704891.1 hypothetical protein MPNT_80010 [Candidatus Methylacidithermus pantelleriae]